MASADFETNPVGTMARIRDLEQWQRDMVAKVAEKNLDGYRELGARAAKAESERDALAAHVERLTSFFDEAERASIAAPATSLARLKAEWQAEAFWQFITEIERAGWETTPALVVNALYARCAELRRQAEGD